MDANSLRVICGPTGAGKSAIALWAAQRHDASIVSADSRQVYQGFDIGTAKPTAEERRLMPHFGIDVLPPAARYSAAHWARDAESWIQSIRASGRTPVVVGGTGFYLKALFGPLFDEPALDPVKREELASVFAGMAVDALRRWCTVLDPGRAHLGRAQLSRALEIALLTGQPLSVWHRERARPVRWTARYLLVDPGPTLPDRLIQRTDAMLAAGWLEETRGLAGRVPADAPAWNATGYGVMRDVAAGTLSQERGRERVIIETRQYAKRQRTWFRHQLAGEHVTVLDPARGDWQQVVDRWWHEHEEV